MTAIKTFAKVVLFVVLGSAGTLGHAYGGPGHRLVGKIADGLLTDNAKAKVSEILGSKVATLETAGPWPDCIKSMVRSPEGDFYLKKERPGAYPECEVFSQGAELELMKLYAKNNWTAESGCNDEPNSQPRHKTYHFADVPIQHDVYEYDATSEHVGVGEGDIVHAIEAAVAILKGNSAPAPFCFAGSDAAKKKQAVMLLTHLLGDLHQPLHVGAIYLKGSRRYDPDAAGASYDEATNSTRGGNRLEDPKTITNCDKKNPEKRCAKNLHGEWDAIAKSLPGKWEAMIDEAKEVPSTSGSIDAMVEQWAGESVQQSRKIFTGMRFTTKDVAADGDWFFIEGAKTLTPADRRQIQHDQIVLAGARLAQILNEIWP